MTPLDYVRDGAAIYRQSFATIKAEANLTDGLADTLADARHLIDDLRRAGPNADPSRYAS
jgi:hypothetical protein